MSRIGIIYCSYGQQADMAHSLAPWRIARQRTLGGHEFLIAGVCCPFEGFSGEPDQTAGILHRMREEREIDHLVESAVPVKETEARGSALKWLEEQGCIYMWQVDADEFYAVDEITAIIRFVEARPYTDWFRLCLKNQVFTPSQYLVEPFTPPRIHKVHNAGGFVAAGFHQDNNVYYERPWNQERILDTQMSSVLVPKSVAWIRHASWLNNSRSKSKVEYQQRRWGNCSFSWDDSKGGLIFNPALPAPEVARDE